MEKEFAMEKSYKYVNIENKSNLFIYINTWTLVRRPNVVTRRGLANEGILWKSFIDDHDAYLGPTM